MGSRDGVEVDWFYILEESLLVQNTLSGDGE
jgi:hypothetical protein